MKTKSVFLKVSLILLIFIGLLRLNANNFNITYSSKIDFKPFTAASGNFIEDFTTTTYMDPITNVSGWSSGEISIPRKNLSLVGYVDTAGRTFGLDLSGDCAYAVAWDWGGLQVINISDPTSPFINGTYSTQYGSDIHIIGNLAYIAAGGDGLLIVDISDPTNPNLITTYDYGGGFSIFASDVFVSGNYAYVADRASFEFVVINVNDPYNPLIVGDTLIGSPGLSVYVSGNYAYVGGGGGDLRIVDISTPSNPTPLGTFSTSGSGEDVIVSGNLAYFAAGLGGFRIVDISNPNAPSQVGSYLVSDYANGVYLSGDLAFLAHGYSGLQIINISDPANPALAGFYDDDFHAEKVIVSGDLAYLIAQYDGLFIINISFINQFETRAVAQSSIIYFGSISEVLDSSTLTIDHNIFSGTSISYYLSPDNGLHWESVTPGLEHQFTYSGNQLKWMSVLNGDSTTTPTISSLNVTYKTVLGPPSLVAPANNTKTNDQTPTFEWSSVSGAYNYRFLLDRSEFFNTINLRNITTSSTTYTPTSNLLDGTWYWRVKANDSEGTFGYFSPTRIIIIDTVPPVAPSLMTPLNNSFSSDSTPTFTWSSVSDADNYTLQVDVLTSFDSLILVSVSGIPNNTYTLISSLSENPWYWRVCAFDAVGNQGGYSSIYRFVVDVSPPLITGEDDTSYVVGTTGHTITWYASDNFPDSYTIKRNGDVLENPSWDGSAISIDIDGLSIGTYTYNCTLYDKAGNSAYDVVVLTVTAEDREAPAIPFGYMFLTFTLIGIISIIIKEIRKTAISD